MNFRGQYALEQMGVISLALVIIAALFFFSMNAASDGARSSQAKDTAERIARAADSAYALGPGSKATVSVNMPQGVQFVDTSNKRVWIRVALSSGDSDVFAKTSGQIVGVIPTTAQLQEITLTMLPKAPSAVPESDKAKYVDAGIDLALAMLRGAGANTRSLTIKLAGGANMFPTISLASATQIGDRNAESAQAKLSSLGLQIASKDIGGNRGRNIFFNVGNGNVEVKTTL